MDNAIKKLYDTFYSNYIYPEDLVKNIKSENYESIEYKRYSGGVMAIAKCTIKELGASEFIYYFDNEDILQKIDLRLSDNIFCYYDRCNEVDCAYKEITDKSMQNSVAV